MVGAAHSWVRSSGSALLHSCPLRVSLHFPFKWPLDTDRTGNHMKASFLPRWHSFLWILDIVMTCDYNLNNRGANESGVYSDIPLSPVCPVRTLVHPSCTSRLTVSWKWPLWHWWHLIYVIFLCDLVLLCAFGKKILCLFVCGSLFVQKQKKKAPPRFN